MAMGEQPMSDPAWLLDVEALTQDGELLDSDGEPADPDPEAFTIISNDTVVATRERAEENGYDVLGPAENVPPGRDAVRIAADSIDTA